MRSEGATGRAAASALAVGLLLAGLYAADLGGSDGLQRAVAEARPDAVGPAEPGPWTVEPYTGLGAWVDVYDWTDEFTGGQPTVVLADVDEMAEAGVQTLYLQYGHDKAAADELEPERFATFVDRAHERGLRVVGWYLPTFADPAKDLRRTLVGTDLGLDGLAIDIESRAVADATLRTERLLALSAALRAEVGDQAIGAITPSAVHLQVVNPAFWPAFPWPELAQTYDAIVPMTYWSIRVGELRSGERYVGENLDRIRASTGDPDVPIHPVGGIADATTTTDLEGMVRAIESRGAIGGSLYDWQTAAPEAWAALAPLTALR